MHDAPKLTSFLGFAILIGCAGAHDDTSQPAGPTPLHSASAAPSPTVARDARQSPAASIMEGRKLFVSNGSTCEPWEIDVPNMLEDRRGRARHAASAGEPPVVVEIERQGDDLMLEAPCFGDKQSLCLGCELLAKPATDLRAFARQDECEEGRAEASAGIRGCVAALDASARAHAKRVLGGLLRDELIARVAASRMVSRGRGSSCVPYHVRKSGKRLFLDWDASEYPEEVTSGPGGIVSIYEVAEPNPRYKPRGPGAISIGCCDGHDYHVLGLTNEAATLRKLPLSKSETASIDELRFTGCPP